MSEEPARRRVAALLTEWACALMPATRQPWAEAMRNELRYIDDDRRALHWAAGCVLVACRERLATVSVLVLLPVRMLVVLLLVFKVFDSVFATAGTIAYHLNMMGAVEAFGQATPGDDFSRLLPLIRAVPAWLHALWLLAGALYLAAMALFALRRREAAWCVVLGLGVERLATYLGAPIIAATGVVVNPNPSAIATIVIPFAVPLLAAAWLWWDSRHPAAWARR